MTEKKSAPQSIMIVDDELIVRESLTKWFRQDGYRVESAEDANHALKLMNEGPWDLALLDIKMPGMSGLDLQKRLKEIDKNTSGIMITAFASVESAVQALKEGAFDYVTKPIDPEHLSHLVTNAFKQRKLVEENVQLREQISGIAKANEIVGESGTGKELIARVIHANSNRRYFPIIAVNCGAMAESLLESELFGHEKGSFTGAQFRRKGKFELSDGGTIFLDEIGSISQKMQVQLLRVLETKQFTRVGGNEVISSDFRVICATNRDLEAAIKDRIKKGRKPSAIILVHLYGMPARTRDIFDISGRYEIPLIEDAAEALGSQYHNRFCGTFGQIGILSFNGNKIITTSGGGALVSDNLKYVEKAKFLATQARDKAPHYQHSEVGYNYRMSNILAGIGRGQLEVLEKRINARRENNQFYRSILGDYDFIGFQNEPEGHFSNFWLTSIVIEENGRGISSEKIRLIMDSENIETRPFWKPMHLQPVFKSYPAYLNGVSERLFNHGLCLPSGSNLTDNEKGRINECFTSIFS